jgi:cytochrome oxidase Cu insertion factor (SCO1/SenC/PrrC family)
VTRRRLLVVVLGTLVLAGVLTGVLLATSRSEASQPAAAGQGPYRGSQPPPGIRIANVSLPSYRGGVVDLGAQRGRVVVLTFLDSKCTDACPIIAAVVAHAWPLLRANEKAQVRAYGISVNPRVDTPASVRTFLAARRAQAALDWLVAPVKQMRPAWKDFRVLPATQTGSDDIHSADVRIFDRRGTWVSTLHAGIDLTPANLVHDIRAAMQSGS